MQLLIKISAVIALCSLLVSNAFCQQVINFHYPTQGQTDTSELNAFAVLMEGGQGFVRVVSNIKGSSRQEIREWQLQQEIVNAAIKLSVSEDTITYLAFNPKKIYGFSPEVAGGFKMMFVRDTASGNLHPVALQIDDIQKPLYTFSLPMWPRDSAGNARKLKPELVKTFFKPYDDYYKNYFSGTKSISILGGGAAKIHLIIVANTNDRTIGESCAKDKEDYQDFFKGVANFLGVSLSTTDISGSKYNKAALENALSSLRPGSNDIVVFYYSGHGFRKTNDGRRYPYIDLRATPTQSFYQESMQMEDIFNTIKRKGARLNLVVSDCCNESVDANPATGSALSRTRSMQSWSEQNIRNLFMNSQKISILATAADRDQRSSSNNKFGGFFSYYFRSSLDNSLGLFSRNVTWDKVLSSAKSNTIYKANHTYCSRPYIPANICEQTPVYSVFD